MPVTAPTAIPAMGPGGSPVEISSLIVPVTTGPGRGRVMLDAVLVPVVDVKRPDDIGIVVELVVLVRLLKQNPAPTEVARLIPFPKANLQ